MKVYALYSKKRNCLMSEEISANDPEADFCNDVDVRLSVYYGKYDRLWATLDREEATEVVSTEGRTPWYNTSHENPSWDHWIFGDLEVVELNDFELEG